jgi:hypothetical protein
MVRPKLHTIVVDGFRFGLDLPPAAAHALERMIRPSCVAMLREQPWKPRTFTIPLSLAPVGVGPVPGPIASTLIQFEIEGPTALENGVEFLVGPADGPDRAFVAHWSRELLDLQLKDLEAWAKW